MKQPKRKPVQTTDLIEGITARQRAMEEASRMVTVVRDSNDAITIQDVEGRITAWNRGAELMFGYTEQEALKMQIWQLTPPEKSAEEMEINRRLLAGEKVTSFETQRLTKDGRLLDVWLTVTKLVNDAGNVIGIAATERDITARKQLEAQYLRAQRLENIGALASGIAHDLNNILAPILMGAPLLQDLVKDQKACRLLKTMETCAQRGAAIVKQVLTFAHGVEGVRMLLQPQALLAEVEALASETFPKSIRIESDAAANLWPVLGDATQLHQVLLNLCINARDAMPRGGILTLNADNFILSKKMAGKKPEAQPGSYVRMRIVDTGTGISPEIKERMFEPFFTTKGVGKGTGLGLSTVQSIVRSHGGFITVVTNVGQGTCFEVYLPATKAAKVPVITDSAVPWQNARGEGILLVDDEAAVREVTRLALMEFGYQVITAGRGTEALRIYKERRQQIQLVLTDMMMPEMDGPTLVAALRMLNPAVKIIGITGMSDTNGMSGVKTLALSAALTKPFTINKLLTVIREALPVTTVPRGTGIVPDGGASRPVGNENATT